MEAELTRIIEQVGRDKGIPKEVLVDALESALLVAVKKKYGLQFEIEAKYNEELGEVEVFQFKEVVKKVRKPSMQISYEEAVKLDPEVELGDSLGVKMDPKELGRIAAQAAKQVIIQKLREAERRIVYNEYKDRKGEIVNGIVRRFERNDVIVDVGRTESLLPLREQIPNEQFKQGDRVRGIIIDVQLSKEPQIVISRTHPDFLIGLFTMSVPEISENIVEIKGAAREPGERAKIAVQSHNSRVDPVGACVGMKGMRIQSVVQELRGEKIDIVVWSSTPAKFVSNALSPTEVIEVLVDEEEKSMEVIVPDNQLSLAIGKKGQNVRLASKLTGWKIDVKTESKKKKSILQARESLTVIPGVGEATAQFLVEAGYLDPEDVAAASIEELETVLEKIPGIGSKRAEAILQAARELIASSKNGDGEEPEDGIETSSQEVN